MGTATDPRSQERAFDIDAERSYWLLHLDALPNHQRFVASELIAAIALGLEATHRAQAPIAIADVLMICYTRLVPTPIASREDILAVMTAVWNKTSGAVPPPRRYVIELERFGQSLMDCSPLHDVALAYVESVDGIIEVRTEKVSATRVRLTYEWLLDQPTPIQFDHLDRYGLRVVSEI